jgi:hypothetical protein
MFIATWQYKGDNTYNVSETAYRLLKAADWTQGHYNVYVHAQTQTHTLIAVYVAFRAGSSHEQEPKISEVKICLSQSSWDSLLPTAQLSASNDPITLCTVM